MRGTGAPALPATIATIAGIGAIAVLLLAAAPAAADTCPNNETVLPATGSDPPYQCAEMHNSDTIKLSAWETDSWTSSPGVGYYNKTTCSYKSDSDVTITTADAGSGLGSYTATATNWDVDKSHHYAAGVLWATGNVDSDGYTKGCYNEDYKDNTGAIENSILELTSLSLSGVPSTATVGKAVTLTATISPSDATGAVLLLDNDSPVGQATLSSGKATITWYPTATGEQSLQAVYNYDSSSSTVGDKRISCPSLSKTCGFSAAQSSTYKSTVSSTSLAAPAAASPRMGPIVARATAGREDLAPAALAAGPKHPPLVTRTKTRKFPANLGLSCGAGQMPMYAQALVRGSGPRALVRHKGSSFRVVKDKSLRGHRITLQLSCRKRSAKTFAGPHVIFGGKSADRIKTRRPRTGVFAGPGKDWVSVASHGSFAHGGLHADRIKVKAADGVATGDPGRDVLKAKTRHRALLVGGQDADKLVGSRGPTLINAADGAGGDVVICHGHRNLVLADRGDTVRGHCGVVRRVRG